MAWPWPVRPGRWPSAGGARRWRGACGPRRARCATVEALAGGRITFAYVANVPDPGPLDPGDVDMNRLADILMAYPRDVDLAALDPE